MPETVSPASGLVASVCPILDGGLVEGVEMNVPRLMDQRLSELLGAGERSAPDVNVAVDGTGAARVSITPVAVIRIVPPDPVVVV